MSENGGTSEKKSLIGEAFELFSGHMELASVEWEYEKSHSLKRMLAIFSGAVMAVTAFALLVIAAVLGLVSIGLSLIQACLAMAVLSGAVSALLMSKWAKRDPKAGTPFKGTREELGRNLKWMRRLLS